jgi:hypothetical protein
MILSTHRAQETNKKDMKQQFKEVMNSLKRPAFVLVAVGVLFTSVSQVIPVSAGQVQYRSIRLSDSSKSANTSITSGIGSGTNVTYRVKFRSSSAYTIKAIVLDFCSGAGTPFIGDVTCPAPAGFSIGATPVVDTADYTVANSSSTTVVETPGIGSGWTASGTTEAPTQTLVLSNATGTALTANTDYTFAITGVTNPSTVGTFYARLMTFTTDTGHGAYTHQSPGTYTDYGGFALSTTDVVQVTAKVQETLTFCVTGPNVPLAVFPAPQDPAVPPVNCDPASGNSAPAITLGHGSNNTLDGSQIDTNDVFTYVSTNALHGVTIRMRNSNACGGLSIDNGTTCDIPAVGPGTAASITPNTAAFGMFCSAITGGTGSVACDANYNDGSNVGPDADPKVASTRFYGMDNASFGYNVTTTFGDIVAASTAPVSGKVNQYQFAATASETTPAGIYKANLSMIATGTF